MWWIIEDLPRTKNKNLSNKMFTSTGYAVDWVATFLHDFPHIDFKFQQTNSTFDPDSKLYKEVGT